LVEKGEFRSDLFYRLNVLTITMSPLRERNGDIMILANHFAQQTANRYGLEKTSFNKEAKQSIMDNSWPGNIRELKHLLERSVLLNSGGELTRESLSLSMQPGVLKSESVDSLDELTLGSAELKLIKKALDKTDGNVTKAAKELGITRMALRYRMQKHNLN